MKTNIKVRLFLYLCFFIIAFCGVTKKGFSQEENFKIQRGDLLSITVMEHPEFAISNVVVLPDGYLQFPAIGRVKAVDMSLAELSDSLESALDTYVVDPIVTVYVHNIHKQQINVFGYLNRPGQHQIFEPTSILNAMSIAGGIKNVRKAKYIQIIRANGDTEKLKVKEIFKNPNVCAPLKPGDTLFVQEKGVLNWSVISLISTTLFGILNYTR